MMAASVLILSSALFTAIPIGIVGNAFSAVWVDRERLLTLHRTRDKLVLHGYSPTEIPVLFRLFDADEDGQLSYNEFATMIKDMEINFDRDQTQKLFSMIDVDEGGGIDHQEFLQVVFPDAYKKLIKVD